MNVRPLEPGEGAVRMDWRYPGPYSTEDVREPLTAERGYFAVEEDGELVGFCCFGEDARVAGMVEEAGVLDVGGGLRPDLTGIGLGGPFLREVCLFGARLDDPTSFRVVIAEFNRRAQLVAAALGFERSATHAVDGRKFVVMTRGV